MPDRSRVPTSRRCPTPRRLSTSRDRATPPSSAGCPEPTGFPRTRESRSVHRRDQRNVEASSIGSPSTVPVPLEAAISPSRTLIVVDFPEPFGPTNPTTPPAGTSNVTSFTATRSPNRRVSPFAVSAVIVDLAAFRHTDTFHRRLGYVPAGPIASAPWAIPTRLEAPCGESASFNPAERRSGQVSDENVRISRRRPFPIAGSVSIGGISAEPGSR